MLRPLLRVLALPARNDREPVPVAALGGTRHGSDAGGGLLAPAAALRLGLVVVAAALDTAPRASTDSLLRVELP